jgi:transcription-repair coupling factor (superfamily II helicase)
MLPELEKFYHNLQAKKAEKIYWQNLHGSATALAIASAIAENPLVVITPNILTTTQLEQELQFYLGRERQIPILVFPDWETLPYDHFSPHEDIISQRLLTLAQMPFLKSGIILAAATTLMHRLPPKNHLETNSFILEMNEIFDLSSFRRRLENQGYICVSKVMTHGEFAVRGSIIDLFPIGSKTPFRIDLLDTKVDSIRIFNQDTQRSLGKISKIHILPAKEHPLNDEAISRFRQSWRSRFSGDPLKCPIYQSAINHENHPGIEYYLPLFFAATASLFDYLPINPIIIKISDNEKIMTHFWQEINDRYEQLRHNQIRPLLAPSELYIPLDQIFSLQNEFPQVLINPEHYRDKIKPNKNSIYFKTKKIPEVFIDNKAKTPLIKLQNLLENHSAARVLFIAESAGRREILLNLLQTINVDPVAVESWQKFIAGDPRKPAIAVAPIEQALHLLKTDDQIETLVITEAQIFGEQVVQYRANKTRGQNPETIVRDLTELQIGAPVVHLDHGIGRYLGLQKLPINGYETEFLTIEYADQAKLYVPVTSLNLISRYTGISAENAPLNHLASKKWEKTKREVQTKIRDVAVEILEIHANRLNARGFAFTKPSADYARFAAAFSFIETPDQKRAIDEVISDMTSDRPMDRLICGDVGFGKTEVAMRAAFLATSSGKQVAILTPTTILAQQHFTNFQDRFVDWPINIALFSRFSSSKEQKNISENLSQGKLDIIISTHKLLQNNVKFKNLGLLIVDEEHRFGVKQKEHIKKLAPHIDILTLTATPIPRTLNMAFATIYDFSIIATPPAKRLAIKTFVRERDNYLIKEAVSREILRGGQIYFLHNDIVTIEKTARELQHLIPTARIAIAHGQMRKQTLEQVMSDFYHLRNNVLVCTTIIESGLDIPTANTIIIDRADRFGLAQLHQLRGRVGRSHHQAYAYLITPPSSILTPDAKKRLDAIISMEDLGAGFILATHDLEIRGAGELLGEEQSGAIQNIGFSLYMEMLEQAVEALKTGREIDIEIAKPSMEVDLQIPALIPDKYIEDMNLRLVLYKRIAGSKSKDKLDDLQSEMIDRFGLLPEFTKNLFKIAELKLKAQKLGIIKIITGASGKGSIEFSAHPNIDPNTIIQLIQKHPNIYKFKGSCHMEFIIKPDVSKINFLNTLLDYLSNIRQS